LLRLARSTRSVIFGIEVDDQRPAEKVFGGNGLPGVVRELDRRHPIAGFEHQELPFMREESKLAEGPDTLREPPHPLVGALIEALPRGSRVLVVGVGNGRHIPPLTAAGFAVDAVDDLGLAAREYDGAISTHALLHGSPATIAASLATIGGALRPGGLFHLTLGSTKDPRCGHGVMIDDATWAAQSGPERRVPHAFFDERPARELLGNWEILALDERSAAETAGRWAHSPSERATIVHWFARLKRR
jgi:hypothetical protein